MRVLTTTVAVSGGDEALLPVRTAEAIPLALHAQAMDLIRGLVVNAPIRMGDVVLENLLNTNIDLIASMDIDPPKQLIWDGALFSYPVPFLSVAKALSWLLSDLHHFKTMPDYGADSETPIHTGIFRFLISRLPAVLISRFFPWSSNTGPAP